MIYDFQQFLTKVEEVWEVKEMSCYSNIIFSGHKGDCDKYVLEKYDAVVDRRRNLQNQLESKLLGITEYEQVIVENDESADSSIHKESSGDNNDLVQHYKKEMDILQEKHE